MNFTNEETDAQKDLNELLQVTQLVIQQLHCCVYTQKNCTQGIEERFIHLYL